MGNKTAALAFLIISCFTCKAAYGWRNPEMTDDAYQIHLVDNFQWHQIEPTELKLTYNNNKLLGNLVLNLYGYSERNATKISKTRTPFTLLATTPVPGEAAGSLDVMQLGLSCVNKEDECNKYDMGYIEIALQKDANSTYKRPGLTSQIVPLGWFLQKNYLKDNFAKWAFGKCRTWFKSESEELHTVMKRLSCPITKMAAMRNPAWYLRTTYLAGFPSNEKRTGNSSAQPAQICFYSAIEDVPLTLHAAPASICCYRSSDSGLLMKEFATPENPRMHGSSVMRSHPFGSDNHHEHYLPGHVPYLSHWYWDKLPYLYCCQWWKGNACVNFYMKLRPAPAVKRDLGGIKAAYVTESHVRQVAGQGAFCPDIGEYWLLRTPAIEIQMRNYVVSRYAGNLPAKPKTSHSEFVVAGSKSAFVTGIAIRSLESPSQVMELVCPEGEFRSYIQVMNTDSHKTTHYEGSMGRGLGTNLIFGDAVHVIHSKLYSILAKHSLGRVGILAFVVHPGEEMMSLMLTISDSLLGNATGVAISGACSDHKITSISQRLFTSGCDNCEDFRKYSIGRPLYFEEIEGIDGLPVIAGIECSGDKVCQYIAWSTSFLPYFQSIHDARVHGIEPMLNTSQFTGWDACQKPNVLGLYVSQDQDFNETNTIQLKCVAPFTSVQGKSATCRRSSEGLEFDYPKDFVCAPSAEKEEEERLAAMDDAEYTKKHYSPEAKARTASDSAEAVKSALETASPGTAVKVATLLLLADVIRWLYTD